MEHCSVSSNVGRSVFMAKRHVMGESNGWLWPQLEFVFVSHSNSFSSLIHQV